MFFPIIGGDGFFDKTQFLLLCEGENNSTSFPDSSGYGHSVTANGDAKISTSNSLWGQGSALFDGTGDFLTVPNAAGFNLSSTLFTLEMFFYVFSYASEQTLISKSQYGASYSWDIQVRSSGGGVGTELRCLTANTAGGADAYLSVTGLSISASAWHHVALQWTGSTLEFYLDGVAVGNRARTITDSPTTIAIGCANWNNPQQLLNGRLQGIRLMKGAIRYTGSFTPSSTRWPTFLAQRPQVLSTGDLSIATLNAMGR